MSKGGNVVAINNLKLGKKLGLMLIIPLVSLVFFSGKQFFNAQKTAAEASAMSELIDMAIATNQLLDTLVIEKEITEKYQRARGKKHGEEMEAARGDSDKAIETLNKKLSGIDSDSVSESYKIQVKSSQDMLATISEKRAAINNKKLRRNKAALFYQELNSNLLDIIGLLPAMSPSKEAAIISAAYSNFLHVKSLAIIERKVLSNVFKNDQFVGTAFSDFNNAVSGQNVYESVYLSLASAEQKEFYKATMVGDYIEKTAAMRAKAFQASDYGAFGIEQSDWIQQQTGKIVLLNKIADSLTNTLTIKAKEMGDAASSILMSAALVSILSIVITLFLGYIIQKGIRESVDTALGIVQKIAKGDLSGNITVNTTDELGNMLESLKVMQTDLKDRIEKDAKISRENSRIRQALDNVSANVMLANQENNIIYMNDAAMAMFICAEEGISKDISGFSVDELVGSNIEDIFNGSNSQKDIVNSLHKRLDDEFILGGHTLHFIANPVISDSDERIGTVVEWEDRTLEVNTEKEIERIVTAAKSGDLEDRIATQGKSGFFLNLSEGINDMVGEISNTLNDIKYVMSALSQGDLTHHITNSYGGTFGEVSDHVNETISKFASVITDIRGSTSELTHTSSEISNGNNSLSSRTEQQASALEETAASMEELTSIVKQNSDNAQQANTLAASAREVANKGGGVVDGAINAMSEINSSSNKIAEIIGVIDEIAFQTNLLALNASVEAARAGEQGRGFAVVATEVRNLAQRSATAAKEIKELIQDSVQKVEVGSSLVNESGETLSEIVQGIKKVGDIVGEIAAASAEQSAGIDQANKAVASMDEMTQQNAALADKTSSQSVDMTQGANAILDQMTFFKLSDSEIKKNTNNLAAKPVKEEEKTVVKKVQKVQKVQKIETVVAPTESSVDLDDSDEWEEF